MESSCAPPYTHVLLLMKRKPSGCPRPRSPTLVTYLFLWMFLFVCVCIYLFIYMCVCVNKSIDLFKSQTVFPSLIYSLQSQNCRNFLKSKTRRLFNPEKFRQNLPISLTREEIPTWYFRLFLKIKHVCKRKYIALPPSLSLDIYIYISVSLSVCHSDSKQRKGNHRNWERALRKGQYSSPPVCVCALHPLSLSLSLSL